MKNTTKKKKKTEKDYNDNHTFNTGKYSVYETHGNLIQEKKSVRQKHKKLKTKQSNKQESFWNGRG